ncbi:hypothetical protein GRI38_00140 [Altererythrobacter aurantiacus]|uniref:Uncharacterized protein n=2 Tax=Parapontixanthobacter aurantiacus TaxID=1463599 RepID=A0A844ZBQ5_9SPHN|nr:hypothetical protein [Parapontixanthobacter aurantiacus]
MLARPYLVHAGDCTARYPPARLQFDAAPDKIAKQETNRAERAVQHRRRSRFSDGPAIDIERNIYIIEAVPLLGRDASPKQNSRIVSMVRYSDAWSVGIDVGIRRRRNLNADTNFVDPRHRFDRRCWQRLVEHFQTKHEFRFDGGEPALENLKVDLPIAFISNGVGKNGADQSIGAEAFALRRIYLPDFPTADLFLPQIESAILNFVSCRKRGRSLPRIRRDATAILASFYESACNRFRAIHRIIPLPFHYSNSV